MVRTSVRGLLVLGLAGMPSVAVAQHEMGHEMRHEVGVDVTGFYQRLSLAGTDSNQIVIGTPVDVRIGFGAGEKLTVEPRLAFAFHSKGNSNGGAAWTLDPIDLNLLWGFEGNRSGPYLTGGAGLRVAHDTSTVTQFGFNGGIGTRIPYEAGAIRLEAFGQYFLKKAADRIPNELNIGVRVGLSLWH